jgi:hypothetical protein
MEHKKWNRRFFIPFLLTLKSQLSFLLVLSYFLLFLAATINLLEGILRDYNQSLVMSYEN